MMSPELSRWLAQVIHTRWYSKHRDERVALRNMALTANWETLADLPADIRAMGMRALRLDR